MFWNSYSEISQILILKSLSSRVWKFKQLFLCCQDGFKKKAGTANCFPQRSENFTWSCVLRVVICVWIPWLLLFQDFERDEVSVLEAYHITGWLSLHAIKKQQQLDVSSWAVRSCDSYDKVISPLWKVPLLVLGSEKRENYSRKLHAGHFHFIALWFLIYPAHASPFGGPFATIYSIFLSACFCHYLEVLCMWLCKGVQLRLTDPGILPPYSLVEGTIMFVLECLWYWGRFWGLWQQELLACNFPFHPSNVCQIL